MSETPNIDLDELGRLVYDAINDFGPEERQTARPGVTPPTRGDL